MKAVKSHALRALFGAWLLLAATAAWPGPHTFAPGQVWTFQASGGAVTPDATLTILAVSTGVMTSDLVHVAISGLKLPNGATSINHIAMTRAGLDGSVVKLLRKEPGPFDMSGYETWLKSGGGAFNGTVSGVLDLIAGSAKASQKK